MSNQKEENRNSLDTRSEDMMTTLPSRHYSGHRKATEEEGNTRIPGRGIWNKELCGGLQEGPFSWRKMEVSAEDRSEQVVSGSWSTVSDKASQVP